MKDLLKNEADEVLSCRISLFYEARHDLLGLESILRKNWLNLRSDRYHHGRFSIPRQFDIYRSRFNNRHAITVSIYLHFKQR